MRNIVFVLDRNIHGTTKLVSYFAVLNYCLVSQTEKEMVRRISFLLSYLVECFLCKRLLVSVHQKCSRT